MEKPNKGLEADIGFKHPFSSFISKIPVIRVADHQSPFFSERRPPFGRMKTRELCLVVIICSILQLTGIAFFARGFFPYKKVLPGFATKNVPEDFMDLGLEPLTSPKRLFDRLVFIVIDALRRYPRQLVLSELVTLCFPPTQQCHSFTGSHLNL